MKRLFWLILIFALLFLLCAYFGKEKEHRDPSQTETATIEEITKTDTNEEADENGGEPVDIIGEQTPDHSSKNTSSTNKPSTTADPDVSSTKPSTTTTPGTAATSTTKKPSTTTKPSPSTTTTPSSSHSSPSSSSTTTPTTTTKKSPNPVINGGESGSATEFGSLDLFK